MPEASGKDILDDLTSFYGWLKSSLPAEVSKLSSGVEADLSQILVAGESAGGYLATQSALHFPEMKFRAIISQYGMIDMENPHFTLAGHKDMAGTPHLPVGVVDDYLATIKKDAVRTSTLPPTLMTFIVETVRQGRLLEFLGNSEDVLPMRKIENVKEVPPFWVVNGDDDEMVGASIDCQLGCCVLNTGYLGAYGDLGEVHRQVKGDTPRDSGSLHGATWSTWIRRRKCDYRCMGQRGL